jgi:Fe-S-cluster containining protein
MFGLARSEMSGQEAIFMEKKDSIFLTLEQAVAAVCLDFRQYEPQVLLFSEIISVLSKGDIIAKREVGKNGIWISMTGQQKMCWLEGSELIDSMCEIISNSKPDPMILAAVCSRVFQTRAFPEKDSTSGETGLRILTGMEGFSCRQCGKCCQILDYHNEVTAEDMARWKQADRTDIMDWVGIFQKDSQKATYRIWMKPGTREYAKTCPFLQKEPHKNQWSCRIHDVKPRICRQYPVSKKHALMTGCPGFLPKIKS